MSTNEIVVTTTDLLPSEVCTHVNNTYVDLGVDTTYEVTGFKREYAVVGDAYFASVTVGDTPAWMVDLINDIIDNSLAAVLGDMDELKLSILASLAELDVAKNQYQELINIEATIDAIIASRLATLNASLANANAQIIDLNITKVTEAQAAAIAVNQISSELTSPTGTLYGAITNIQTTVTSLNNELDARYLELYNLSESTAFALSIEINRVEASIGDVTTALIESMGFALATDVLAVANQLVSLSTTVSNNYATVTTQLNATTSQTASNTSAITTLRSDMDGSFASVESELSTFATSLGAVGARYGVKLTAGATNPSGGSSVVVGGFELLNDGSVVTGGFDVDQFWVGRVGITGKRPFVVDAGIVYIDTAVIKTASIDFAKISDTLQSTNYVANTSGWVAQKNGYAEFQNIKARGDIRASSLISNLVVTDAIRSSNFNVASPLTSPGWGIFEDGRAYFASPVISRPNIVVSGEIVRPAVGSWTSADFQKNADGITWKSNTEQGPIVMHYAGGTILRHLELTVDLNPADYPNADVWTTYGPLLGVSCVVTEATFFYSGGDPGAPYGRIGCSGTVERVGDLTSTSFIRIRFLIPLPDNLKPSVRGIHVRNLSWSLLALT